MSGYKSDRHRGLKGNAVLAVTTVLLGCAVLAGALALFKKTPAAAPVQAQPSSAVTSSTSKPQNVSSKPAASSAQDSSAVSPRNLENALFIGDSLTEGLSLYGGIDKKAEISENNLTAYTAANRTYTFGGKKQKATAAAAAAKPDSIYIMVGSNDIDKGNSTVSFSQNYGKLIDALQSGCPGAKIFVQSILPVTTAYEAKNKSLTNEKINQCNAALQILCTQKGAVYVDVASAFKGADGALPAESSSDGLHLKKDSYKKWVDYLQSGK